MYHNEMARFSISSLIFIYLHNLRVTKIYGTKVVWHLSQMKSDQAENETSNLKWPHRDKTAVIEGDIMLGGLMMVHERDDRLICGKIMPQGGMQATEAMLFTLDRINAMDLIPGVRLGARIKDDCDGDIYGLEQSVEFIRGSIEAFTGKSSQCKDDQQTEQIVGVVGAPSSVTSIQVANLLKLFKIPQISFFSTSPSLSSMERFPYFLRTIPSDIHQADAMVELVQMFGWQYVSIVYEESSYGQMGYEAVRNALRSTNICIAVTSKVRKDSGVATSIEYDNIVKQLLQKSSARGVIIFASDQEVSELMKAIKRADKSSHFTWIGSDGWGGRTLVSDGNELQVEGAVTVQPYAEPIHGFQKYFLKRTPTKDDRNPWFVEYWEDYFKCRIPGSQDTPFNTNYSKVCDPDLKQTWANGFELEAQLQFVSDAVMAFAFALRDMHQDKCGGKPKPGLCQQMEEQDGRELLKYLLKVNFNGLSGLNFRFLSNGDGVPRYRILHFKQIEKGVFAWETVGIYENQELKIDQEALQFTWDSPVHPASVCSADCLPTQAQVIHDLTQQCCWTCVTCAKYEYLPTPYACEACDRGMRPSPDLTQCLPIPVEYLRYNSPIALSAMAFSVVGIVCTVFVTRVFIQHRDTPVVRASGRELSFVLLLGILLCYGLTFAIISPPSDITCAAQMFGIGFCFTLCYSAVLTKTNRIARIFRAGKRTVKRPKWISPRSQLAICGSMVLLYTIIAAIWMTMCPPKAGFHYPTREDHQLVCLSAVGLSYMIGFSYPILLILICTFYACLTRKIPEAFNESKYIGFTMYTTCIIWLAFVPIYFSTANNIEIRLATLCFSISLSATVALVCMFTPKLYIILYRPERNVRQSMMTARLAKKEKSPMNTTHSKIMSSSTEHCTELNGTSLIRQRKLSYASISSIALLPRPTAATQTSQQVTNAQTQTLFNVDRKICHQQNVNNVNIYCDIEDVYL